MGLRLISIGMVVALAGCGSNRVPSPPGVETTNVNPTVRLELARDRYPGPGLCRIVSSLRDPNRGVFGARSCDGIENAAPVGSIVLYRPRNAREIHVRYMDTSRRGVVYRTDIFDMDTKRLIREIN